MKNNQNSLAIFENFKIRRHYDEKTEIWYFSVIDIIAALTEQTDFKKAKSYWTTLKSRLKSERSEVVTKCDQLKMLSQDGKMRETDVADVETILRLIQSVKDHKKLKGLKTQNLRDHMSEEELIFTALAELSTRRIAETEKTEGLKKNKIQMKHNKRSLQEEITALDKIKK